LPFPSDIGQEERGSGDGLTLVAWDGEDCAGVQERMAAMVAERLTQTRSRIADLTELAAQVQVAQERLAVEPRTGGCDERCARATAGGDIRSGDTQAVLIDHIPLRSQ
jgi:hypothetical protein